MTQHTRSPQQILSLALACALAACSGGATNPAAGSGPGEAASMRISAITPAAGSTVAPTPVTIDGTGFVAGTRVRFDGIEALSVTHASDQRLVAVAPPHAPGPVDLELLAPDGSSQRTPSAFRYDDPPVLSFVDPGHLPVDGGAVILHGAHFAPGATVAFGAGASVGAPRWLAADQLVAVAPAHPAGTVDVSVTNPDGQRSTLPGALAYDAPAPPPPPPPPAPPVLAGVAPASGPDAGGTAVTLTGTGFDSRATASFGGSPATVTAATPTSLSVVAPPHAAGAVDVSVANPDGQRATLALAYAYVAPPPPAPRLDALAPTSGPATGGTTVALSGAAFQAGARVSFGGAPAAVLGLSATGATVTAPAHAAGAVDVVVTNPDGQAAALRGAFTYQAPPPPPPVIAAVAPSSGPAAGGTVLAITGSGFAAGAAVTVGGAPAAVASLTSTAISATTPAHLAGAADVVVRNPDGQGATLAAGFTYVAPPPPPPSGPGLASIAPASGPDAGGTVVTLTGTGFQAGAAVSFGGTAAVVSALSATSISATTPAHLAGTVDVVVANPGGLSATLPGAYTYVAPPPPPSLVSVTPASGSTAGGTAVVLAGSGFAAGATVTVGGVAAVVTGVAATAISLTTPAHAAGPADVVVTNPGGQSSALAGGFTYVAPPPPPVLAAVAPTAGSTAGGTAVTLSGTGFATGASVTFGGVSATVTGATATALAVVTPAHAAGAVAVSLVNPDGQASTLAAAYTYAAPPAPPPALASVSPASGPVAGGTPVTLTGAGFAAGASVTFAGAAAAVSAVSATSISATAPPGAAGPANVVVRNPDGQSSALAGGFTYLAPPPPAPPPALVSVSPVSGSTLGGNSVTLSGTGFAAGAAVTFGGVAAAIVSTSATAITAAAPVHAAGAVNVAVVNPDGQSSTLPAAYSYVAPVALPPLVTAIAPTSGTTLGGTAVTVTGKDFVNPVVSFGGAFATLVSVSATSLGVLAPPHAAGTVDVVVTNADNQSATAAAAFTYVAPPTGLPAPVISSVTPVSGPIAGGTLVTVAGANFVAGSTVSFGGASGLAPVVTATAITVTTPAGAAGAVDVTVVNPDRQASTLARGFTYTAPAPVVLALSIHGSPQAGGQQVVLAGSGLGNAVSVTFGGVPATGLTFDPATGSLSVVTPASPLGPTADVFVPMVVTNADGQTATVPSFHYGPPPVATGFTPTTAPRGAPVTITGSAFTADATGARAGLQVSFGGTVAIIQSKTPTQIVVAVPKLNPGVYQVFVTNFDGQFTVSPGTFTAPGP